MAAKKSNGKKVGYIIMEKSFEYDDNYYTSTADGGITKSIYLVKEDAITVAKRLNREQVRAQLEDDIRSYLGEGSGFFENPTPKLKALFKKVFDQDYEEWDENYGEGLKFNGTDAELDYIIENSSIPQFFYVDEAELVHALS